MLHAFFVGIVLGLGAAIPVGPINLEMIRRNLQHGFVTATFFGLGACCADLTYLLLLALGVLSFLTNLMVLKAVTLVGVIVLLWFGVHAIIQPVSEKEEDPVGKVSRSYVKNLFGAYLLTLLSPFTILFWASVSAQIALYAHHVQKGGIAMAAGVIVGTVSWVVCLNTTLHCIRHKLSHRLMRVFNVVGGCIILLFAAYSVWHVFHLSVS